MRLVQIEGLKSHKAAARARGRYAPKCQSCGACCSFYAWQPMRMPAPRRPLAGDPAYTFQSKTVTRYVWPDGTAETFRENIHWMRREKVDGWWRCTALRGTLGKAVSCGVYRQRPPACRDFDPGSPMCQAIREWAGIDD